MEHGTPPDSRLRAFTLLFRRPTVTALPDRDGQCAVRCVGGFDADTLAPLKAACDTAHERGIEHLVLDVRRVAFADSSILNLLLTLRQEHDVVGPPSSARRPQVAPVEMADHTAPAGSIQAHRLLDGRVRLRERLCDAGGARVRSGWAGCASQTRPPCCHSMVRWCGPPRPQRGNSARITAHSPSLRW